MMKKEIFFSILYLYLQLLEFIDAEESLLWYSADKNINLIAPNYLPESKKENRRLAVVVDGSSKMVQLTCVMNGFEGNKTSKPKWTTDFQTDQIVKDDDGTSWINQEYAGWEVNVTVSSKDSGNKKISCNYQQGYFAKVIEVEFNVYTVRDVSVDDLNCAADQESCEGDVKISYYQMESDAIPYDKITSDVEKQIENIYNTSNVAEDENVFTTLLELQQVQKIKSLKKEKWIRNGTEVMLSDNNFSNLCECRNPATTIPSAITNSSTTTTTTSTTYSTTTTATNTTSTTTIPTISSSATPSIITTTLTSATTRTTTTNTTTKTSTTTTTTTTETTTSATTTTTASVSIAAVVAEPDYKPLEHFYIMWQCQPNNQLEKISYCDDTFVRTNICPNQKCSLVCHKWVKVQRHKLRLVFQDRPCSWEDRPI